MLKKVVLHSVATALASRVLPVPVCGSETGQEVQNVGLVKPDKGLQYWGSYPGGRRAASPSTETGCL